MQPALTPAMLEAMFAAAPEAIFVVDSAGLVRFANPRAEELFAYAPGALAGRSVDALVPAALTERHGRHRASYDADPRTRPMGEGLELRGRRADGVEFPIDVALGPAEFDGERYVVAIVRDITLRKRDHDELRYLSEHDALTGLLNRRGLDHQLARAIAHARRHGIPTALLLIDLDNFKSINDRFGHLQGDRVLCDVVQALRERLRAGDTIARLGGDELAVIAPFTSRAAASVLAHDLGSVVRDTASAVTHAGDGVTASIGIAQLGGGAQDAMSLIVAADAAMYEAKRAGGDSVAVAPFEPQAAAARGA